MFEAGFPLIDGRPCAPSSGDVGPGTRITVTDASGSLRGTGSLEEGELAVDPNFGNSIVPARSLAERKEFVYVAADCAFGFTIPLMGDADFYMIAVDGRDGYVFSHRELESLGWIVKLGP